jgi:hypothetical protein
MKTSFHISCCKHHFAVAYKDFIGFFNITATAIMTASAAFIRNLAQYQSS